MEENEAHEFYKFITNDYNPPLGYFHHSIEGNINFKSLLFIPQTAPIDFMQLKDEKSLHLYSNKVLIQDDCQRYPCESVSALRVSTITSSVTIKHE
ncbi:hypothetical protein ACFL3D_06740 [Candidatus Omnitrophota bacterium]